MGKRAPKQPQEERTVLEARGASGAGCSNTAVLLASFPGDSVGRFLSIATIYAATTSIFGI